MQDKNYIRNLNLDIKSQILKYLSPNCLENLMLVAIENKDEELIGKITTVIDNKLSSLFTDLESKNAFAPLQTYIEYQTIKAPGNLILIDKIFVDFIVYAMDNEECAKKYEQDID